MPSIFDLNNAFVYYLSTKTNLSNIEDYLKVLNTNGVQLIYTGAPPTYSPTLTSDHLNGNLDILDTTLFDNNSTAEDEFKVDLSGTNKAEFSVAVTEGVKLGVQTKVMASIPFFLKSEVELSAEASLSSTQRTSSSTEQTFAFGDRVKVPPRSRIKASLAIQSLTYNGTLTTKVRVAGTLVSTAPGAVFTITMSQLFRSIKAKPPANFTSTDKKGNKFSFTKADADRFTLASNPNQVFYTTTANISANFGARQVVQIDQFKVGTNELIKKLKTVKG